MSGINLKPSSMVSQKSLQDLAEIQDRKIRSAAKLYESQFLREMVKAMKSTVSYSDFRKRSQLEKIYDQKIYEKQVDDWTKRGGVGFADIIYNQIKQQIKNQMGGGLPGISGPIPVKNWKGLPFDGGKSIKLKDHQEKSEELEKLKTTGLTFPKLKPFTEVLSPWNGRVAAARLLTTGEALVSIEHPEVANSLLSYRGPMQVKVNQEISAGEVIGNVGREGGNLVWKLQV